jgi:hypothetical protein
MVPIPGDPPGEVGETGVRGSELRPVYGLAALVWEEEETDGDDVIIQSEMSPLFFGEMLLSALEVRPYPMIIFRGTIGGKPAHMLLDTGANLSFVCQRWAEQAGLNTTKLDSTASVIVADGHRCQATAILRQVTVEVVDTTIPLTMVVVSLGTYDAILGLSWFHAVRPRVDWDRWTVNGHKVEITGGRFLPELNAVGVTVEYEDNITRLLREFASVFAAVLPRHVPNTSAHTHSFQMKEGAIPVRDGERNKGPAELELARAMVKEGEAMGIIEASDSEWCSQLVMVVKKDSQGVPTGKTRFCVDYRRVNSLMRKDSHPLPLPAAMFSHLNGARLFSKLDLTSGFYQIALAPQCRKYLAFSTPDGLRQWTVMPFGVANAPATFQREMQRVLRDRLDKGVMVYIDDILIYSETVEQHEELVRWVLTQLSRNVYYANPKKCEFFRHQVDFLGHVVSAGGLAVQQQKVDAMVSWPTPRTVRDVRSFLGLTGYYRNFIRGYSGIASPLFDLTHKDAPFLWAADQEAAFVALKKAVSSAPILIVPDWEKPYSLYTDASGYAIGAMLCQDHGAGPQPIAFMSKKMNLAQRNYPVHEWELLAVIEALRVWRCFLWGTKHPIDIYTDHHSLQYINTQPHLSARQCRWVEMLQEYTFKVHYIRGETNVVADALSRRSDHEEAFVRETEALRQNEQESDEATRPRLRLMMAGLATTNTSSALPESLLTEVKSAAVADVEYQQRVLQYAHYGLVLKDGLLYSDTGRLYIPDNSGLRTRILAELHDAPTGGHKGRDATWSRLVQLVHWAGMYDDVRDYVTSCVTCAAVKKNTQATAGLLRPLPIPLRRWETISLDFVGPFPRTSAGYNHLLVVVDKFSKMVHLIPTTDKVTSVEVAQLVFDGVIRLHGFPENMISDRDSKFTAKFWQALWKLSGTRLRMSTSWHPQTDGQTEVVNRAVQNMLRCYVNAKRNDWDKWLTPCEMAINNTRHVSHGYTPHFLNAGYEMRMPIAHALHREIGLCTVPAAAQTMSDWSYHDETARSRLIAAQEKQKKSADRHRREDKYRVGDEVMLSADHLTGYDGKLLCHYLGPFRVSLVRDVTLTLELPAGMRTYGNVHQSRVKRYTRSKLEWEGREQQDRPRPLIVTENEQEEYEVEAILAKDTFREPVSQLTAIAGPGDTRRSARIRTRQIKLTAAPTPSVIPLLTPSLPTTVPKRTRVSPTPHQWVVRYLIKWKGYGMEESSWERAENLTSAQQLVDEYEAQQQAEKEAVTMSLVMRFHDK